MRHVPFLIRVWLLFLCADQMLQHGQEILDSLAEIKKSIITRHEQWQANPSSVQFQPPQPPASNPVPQPLVAHRSIHSHGTNTPTSSSTPSSSRSRASIPPRSRTPSPYNQSPHEEDMARHERVDAMLRDEPRWREEVYSADGARPEQLHAREDDTRRRREWEEEGRRRTAEQRRQEQDGIFRRQQEAEYAAQAARLGHQAGQNQVVTASAVPVSASFSAANPSSVQYPSLLSGPGPTLASASSGPVSGHLQMPLETPNRCVIPH